MRPPSPGSCPQCGTAIRREGQKFCTTCGCRLSAGEEATSLSQPATNPATQPVPEAEAADTRAPEAQPSISLSAPSPPAPGRTVRALYFELGSALLAAGRYDEALEALERAANEPAAERAEPDLADGEPTPLTLQLQLALASERAGQADRALRTYLQAPRLAPGSTLPVLEHAHTLLSAETALSLGCWIHDKWKPEIEEVIDEEEERGAIALFEGHLHLFRADYEQALHSFAKALQLAPERARSAASLILAPERLPPALAAPSDGSAHHQLARLYQTFGLHREAEEHARRALDLGLPGDGYPEAEVQQLLGEALSTLGAEEEAAEWLYEAGRRRLWREELDAALSLFAQALEHRPDHAMTHWQLMETHRVRSYLPDSPYADEDRVEDALRAWEAGLSANGGEPDVAWVYVSRGLIGEQLARLDDDHAFRQYWDSIRLYLCALVLDRSDPYAWGYLGRNTRNLNLTACTLWALDQLLLLDPDHQLALEERAAILANLGRFGEAEEAISRLRELQPEAENDFMEAVRAFVYLYGGRAHEALPLLQPLVDKAKRNVWYRSMLAESYERLGDSESALQQHRQIFELCRESESDNLQWARSALMLGELEEARERYAHLVVDQAAPPGNGLRGIGFCHLIRGEVEEGRKALSEGIALIHIGWHLDHLEQFELPHVRRVVAEASHRTQVEQAVAELELRIEARRAALLAEARSPADELRDRLAGAAEAGEDEELVRVAARAALARVLAVEGSWNEAAEQYLALLPDAPLFPLLGRALQEAVNALCARGRERLRAREPREALQGDFEPALQFERLSPIPSVAREVEIHAMIAFAHLELEREEAAQAALRDAFVLVPDLEPSARVEVLSALWRGLLGNLEHYWQIQDRLASLALRPELPEDLGTLLQETGRGLEEYLVQALGMGAEAGENLRWSLDVPAILLHLGEALVTKDSTPLGEQFQAMRERIHLETGVEIPQIQYHVNPGALDPASYSISLDDVPHLAGRVRLGWLYTPAPAEQLRSKGLPDGGVEEIAPHIGAWLAPEHRERAASLGMEIWDDPLRFVVAHLEVVLRHNLESFLGYEEALRLLERHASDSQVAALLRSPILDGEGRLRLARLLRALVRERVPVTDLPAICGTLAEGESLEDDPADALRRVRLQLRDRLPGNQAEVEQLLLEEELENRLAAGVHRRDGRTFLALLPQEAQELMAALREQIEPALPAPALVVRQAELRPFLWRLLQYEFPQLPVLSLEEALHAEPPPSLEAAREDAHAR